jgi:hypothetical protein
MVCLKNSEGPFAGDITTTLLPQNCKVAALEPLLLRIKLRAGKGKIYKLLEVVNYPLRQPQ